MDHKEEEYHAAQRVQRSLFQECISAVQGVWILAISESQINGGQSSGHVQG